MKKISLLILASLLFSNTLLHAGCCEQLENFSIHVDYLFWKSEADQTAYALFIPGGVPLETGLLATNRIITQNPCFEGSSGVRAAIAYDACNICDDLDVALVGTHFNNCNFSQIKQTNSVVPTGLNSIAVLATTASSAWQSKLNRIDFEIGRTWQPCDAFDIRGYMGITWARLKLQQIINYPDVNLEGISLTSTFTKCNRFSGVGPRFGITTDWCLWRNLSLIGDVSGALLYGDLNTKVNASISSSNAPTVKPDFIDCKKRLRPVAQMFLGLGWEDTCSCIDFDLAVGYEAQYWWNQWQAFSTFSQPFSGITNQGDWTAHGLTLRAGIHF